MLTEKKANPGKSISSLGKVIINWLSKKDRTNYNLGGYQTKSAKNTNKPLNNNKKDIQFYATIMVTVYAYGGFLSFLFGRKR